MKKSGFTLAEVLITLSIIGVVAAMTLPNLQTDIVQRQIGPKLAKAVSTFEQASEALLNERMSDSLIDADIVSTAASNSTGNDLASNLTDFMKASSDGATVTAKDGTYYQITINNGNTSYKQPHNNLVGSVLIDIDGNAKGADSLAEDRFRFSLYDDGSLRAYGSANYLGSKGTTTTTTPWLNNCDKTHSPNTNAKKEACTGYIFENNLKADYKLD